MSRSGDRALKIVRFRLHPSPLRLEAGTPQLAHQQLGVVGIVLRDQHSDGFRHLALGSGSAR